MKVTIAVSDGLVVEVEAEGEYAPDVCHDLCARARELYAEVQRDLAHFATDLEP